MQQQQVFDVCTLGRKTPQHKNLFLILSCDYFLLFDPLPAYRQLRQQGSIMHCTALEEQ